MSISLNRPTQGSTNWFTPVDANWQTIQDAFENLQAVNSIINPQGKVAQRNAFSGQVGSPGTYGYGSCDRWKGTVTGTTCTAGTLTQDSSAPVGNSGYAVRWSGVTATGSGVCIFRQYIESKDAVKFINRNAILSINVQHDVGSNVNFQLNIYKASGGLGKDDFSSITTIQAGSQQSIATGTPTALNSGTVAMGACGNGILVEVQVAIGAVTTKNVWITDVQLQLGSVVTACQERAFQQELAMCQRYFFTTGAGAAIPVNSPNNGTLFLTVSFPVQMRIAPSGTLGITAGNYANYPGSSTTWCLFIQGSATSQTGGAISVAAQASNPNSYWIAITGATWSNTPAVLQPGSTITFLTVSTDF